ncbi:MAG: YgiT-type zinc finger protein [Planctomycetes bacterium]|nr:YgiT-type zinc finger protein [Planctomycetota bacterium]
MKCANCGHEIAEIKSRYTINRYGYQLSLEGVPAFGCQACGARYFKEEEVDAIQRLLEHLDKDFRKVLAIAG